jgi:hypothetical protein
LQLCAELHAWHATPPTPQVALELPWHTPFASQQPLGHDLASHTHFPPLHS